MKYFYLSSRINFTFQKLYWASKAYINIGTLSHGFLEFEKLIPANPSKIISFVGLSDPFWLHSIGMKSSNWSTKNQLTVIWLIVITPLISRIGFSITVQWLVAVNELIAQPPADILKTLIHHHFFLLLIKIYIFHCINIANAFVMKAAFFHCLCVHGSHGYSVDTLGPQACKLHPRTQFKLDPPLIHPTDIYKRTTTCKSLC